MTLREFIEKINFYEHYRVYLPNRDCLIFESYFKIHSPYYFNKDGTDDWFNENYYSNNTYFDGVYKTKKLDEETKIFLDRFGDCEIFSLEIGSFRPCKIVNKDNSNLKIEYVVDENRPGTYLNCFDIFIKY